MGSGVGGASCRPCLWGLAGVRWVDRAALGGVEERAPEAGIWGTGRVQERYRGDRLMWGEGGEKWRKAEKEGRGEGEGEEEGGEGRGGGE